MRMTHINRIVAFHYNLNPIEMKKATREWKYSHPRQVSMYFCRELTLSSFKEIAFFHGLKDHSTVVHACEKYKNDRSPELIQLKKLIKETWEQHVK